MRSGVILAFALDTRRQEYSKMSNEFYNVYNGEELLYSNLTEEEFFDKMEDLSIQFYNNQTGAPRPEALKIEITTENHYG